MVAGELSKPKGVDFSLPDKDPVCGPIGCINGNRLYTILLDKNDNIITYSGLLEFPLEKPKKLVFENNSIRKEIFAKKEEIQQYMAERGKPNSGVIIIIKPSQNSNFKNLVDILDEMAIAKIDSYAIVDEYSSEETKLLASN